MAQLPPQPVVSIKLFADTINLLQEQIDDMSLRIMTLEAALAANLEEKINEKKVKGSEAQTRNTRKKRAKE